MSHWRIPQQGGRNADVNAPPRKRQQQGGSGLPVGTGTAQLAAWVLAFGICAVACLVGSVASIFLSRDLGRERAVR
jgi:hypothetical protein